MSVLDQIVKAYDIRGTVPDQLDSTVAHALGVGFAKFVGTDRILIGRDMRPSGPELVDAFAAGVMEQGIDVIDIGLASTDLVYFAAGSLDSPAAMFTASHNPAQYNGIKLCHAGARPIGIDSGLAEIRSLADRVLAGDRAVPAVVVGKRSERDLLEQFIDHVMTFVDPTTFRSLRVVADVANGMGGLVVPAAFERLAALDLEVMFPELDGTFPNHPADPLVSSWSTRPVTGSAGRRPPRSWPPRCSATIPARPCCTT
jgi:phosphomannomutase